MGDAAIQASDTFGGREPFVSLETAAAFVGVSPRTLHRWLAGSERFPVYCLGRLLRFRISEVERWVHANKVPARVRGAKKR